MVNRYNEIVEKFETDPSLKIDYADEGNTGRAKPNHAAVKGSDTGPEMTVRR